VGHAVQVTPDMAPIEVSAYQTMTAAGLRPVVPGPKRRVCLVMPPSPFLLDERVFVSLGILKVAAVLEQAGHSVNVLDLSGVQNFTSVFETYLETSKDETIGFTATTPQLPSALRLARLARERRPDIRLIAGGPHVTLTHSAHKLERQLGRIGRAAAALATLENAFDVLCAGDGEIAILHAIQPSSPRIVDGDDRKGGMFMTDEMYDASPFPARHLIDLRSYKYAIEGHNATSLIAQLGCPFACGFCGGRHSASLRVIRTRSIESTVGELEALYKTYGYTGYMLYDDELNVNKSLVALMDAIADLQDRLGVEFRLRGFVKAELFTDEQARAMYRAGFRWLLCGFEAGHPRILKNIQKRATLADNTRAVEIARRHGLRIKALMSVGHPGETEGTVAAVAKWLIEMAVDDFDCTIITTYPGTPYYDLSVAHDTLPGVWTYTAKSGDRLHARDVDFSTTADYYKGAPGTYQAYVFTDYLTSEQLAAARDDVENAVRAKLGIPFNHARAAILYDHSMGQGLPPNILRSSSA
jgi:anaerobic magnesium-protoporphyrin IX monomethyl ester cyclase